MNLSCVKGYGRWTNDAYIFVISEDADVERDCPAVLHPWFQASQRLDFEKLNFLF